MSTPTIFSGLSLMASIAKSPVPVAMSKIVFGCSSFNKSTAFFSSFCEYPMTIIDLKNHI